VVTETQRDVTLMAGTDMAPMRVLAGGARDLRRPGRAAPERLDGNRGVSRPSSLGCKPEHTTRGPLEGTVD